MAQASSYLPYIGQRGAAPAPANAGTGVQIGDAIIHGGVQWYEYTKLAAYDLLTADGSVYDPITYPLLALTIPKLVGPSGEWIVQLSSATDSRIAEWDFGDFSHAEHFERWGNTSDVGVGVFSKKEDSSTALTLAETDIPIGEMPFPLTLWCDIAGWSNSEANGDLIFKDSGDNVVYQVRWTRPASLNIEMSTSLDGISFDVKPRDGNSAMDGQLEWNSSTQDMVWTSNLSSVHTDDFVDALVDLSDLTTITVSGRVDTNSTTTDQAAWYIARGYVLPYRLPNIPTEVGSPFPYKLVADLT